MGWTPFKASAIQYQNGQIKYAVQWFSLWDSYGIKNHKVKTGSFVQDSRGRWYVCLVVDTPEQTKNSEGKTSIGIDLGLKDFATPSNGQKIEAQRTYRKYEQKFGIAQRANQKQRVKFIHAKIKNIRNDFLHKLSRQLVNDHAAIFVGNVNAAKNILALGHERLAVGIPVLRMRDTSRKASQVREGVNWVLMTFRTRTLLRMKHQPD